MMRLSACIEWLFADVEPAFERRIAAARQAGFDLVEFWRWSNKDIETIEAALVQTGVQVAAMVAEPLGGMTDPAGHGRALSGLHETMAVARRLKVPVLIAQTGNAVDGVPRPDQRAAVVACLKDMAGVLKGSGIRLGIEPLNTRIDHQGHFLDSTVEALDIVDAVDRPEIGIVYDLYHSAVMGEATEVVLAGRVDRIIHVHVADHPGRGEPGRAGVDPGGRLRWLRANGYAGPVGLEYRPQAATVAGLAGVRAALEA